MKLKPDTTEYDCEPIGTLLVVMVGHDAGRDEREFWSSVDVISHLQVQQLRQPMNDMPGRPEFSASCQKPIASSSCRSRTSRTGCG